MALPPTQLHWLIDFRSPRRIFRRLAAEGLFTEAAARDRRLIIAGLAREIACPRTGWTMETNEHGEPTGRAAPQLGGRTLNTAVVDVLWPYLNERGQAMATTPEPTPPARPRRSWWRFWTWFWPRRRPALSVPADGRVLFYKRDRAAFGFLSNFHPAPFTLDGEAWPTAEHYYQAQKSDDPEYRQAVRAAATPGRAKRLGAAPGGPRKAAGQSWFRQHGKEPRADWDAAKVEVMRRAVRAKFEQNPELAGRLRATGAAELVEDSDADSFWGAGADGRGQNWLGRMLMEVRQQLPG